MGSNKLIMEIKKESKVHHKNGKLIEINGGFWLNYSTNNVSGTLIRLSDNISELSLDGILETLVLDELYPLFYDILDSEELEEIDSILAESDKIYLDLGPCNLLPIELHDCNEFEDYLANFEDNL